MAEQNEASLESNQITINFTHHGKQHEINVESSATVADLASAIQDELFIPINNQKLMISKLGLLKAPFGDRPVSDLLDRKVTLIGTSSEEIASLAAASQHAAKRDADREAHLASARRNLPKAYSSRDPKRAQEDNTYTFMTLRPLLNLPNSQRSLAFLERLKADPGIRAAMRAHKFSVGLLTEMDPLSYTESSHEGTTRILGLNRNKGEVIELRLRTDAYDGYRDYKTIRRTLCHELTHNVHSDHDRKFWDLCHQIEREVEKADWKSGGRSVGELEHYEPSEEIAYDHGGWTGGEFVLGGGGGTPAMSASSGALSRREIIAKAAEERMKKQKQAEEEAKGDR
ncbi:WLM-domain-containing protein [Hypoxylon trugodes]|uniref:WLM-domain-containing protein n=1 Tax=Hypoxylon trugodes TaxID=326681 RepID=UPI00219DEAEF|nr:WLM-domain-containing protein [Hypoxylon trugodes]KAI1388256.1 WLM-domain-containing protein [Hypoxylon trugodes]